MSIRNRDIWAMATWCGFAFSVLLGVTPCAAVDLANGGFEQWAEGKPVGWKIDLDKASATVAEHPLWRRLARTFNSGDYRTLRVYLRLQEGTGTVWFDSVSLSGIDLCNPSLELTDGENRIAGWQQDNVGDTVFHTVGVAHDGQGCVCIRQDHDGMSRIWQTVPCKSHQQVTFSVWARSVDNVNAYAEVYGVRENGELGSFWPTQTLANTFSHKLTSENHHALVIRAEDGGRICLSQSVRLPPHRLCTLRADLRLGDTLAEAVRLRVVDAKTGTVLGESGLDARTVDASGWVEPRVDFVACDDGLARVEIDIHGPALSLALDNVRLGTFKPHFPLQKVCWREGQRGLRWSMGMPPAVQLPDDPAVKKAWELLLDALGAAPHAATQNPAVRIKVTGADRAPWPAEEHYHLRVSDEGVHIQADNVIGVRWALVTLAGLGVRAPDGAWLVDACEIEDWPDMPLRMTYRGGLPRDSESRRAFCRRLLRLKMNGLVMEDARFFDIANQATCRVLREAFAEIRSYGITPIPEMQSFGHASSQISRDPRVAEGKWVRDEAVVLKEAEPTALSQRNVIRTAATDVTLTDASGKTTYELGRDFEVLDGSLARANPQQAKPVLIRRTPNIRIADGEAVRASYDVVAGGGTYCPSEPLVYEMCLPALKQVITALEPRYVHIGHDEPTRMQSDSRCIRRAMSEAALIVEDIRRWRQAAQEADPKVRLMMWADPLNPYHNGRRVLDDPNDFSQLPQDIIMNVWFYGAGEPQTRGMQSLEFFAKSGIATTGSPWDGQTCARNWATVGKTARERGLPYLGALYTSWDDRWGALEATAAGAWKTKD